MGRYVRPAAAPLTSPDRWRWQDAAECRGEELELFFGPDGERQPEREIREAEAKQLCWQCPSRYPCLDYAIDTGQKHGLWGGLNEDERARERRSRARRDNASRRAA